MDKSREIVDRIMSRVIQIPESGCWIWEGATFYGYGQVTINNKTRRVHRLMYEIEHGPIPPGLVCDHLCRVRCCVNPHHIELVTDRENLGRGIASSSHAIRTNTCKHGHAFTPENTLIRKGFRECHTCYLEYKRQYRLRKKQAKIMIPQAGRHITLEPDAREGR